MKNEGTHQSYFLRKKNSSKNAPRWLRGVVIRSFYGDGDVYGDADNGVVGDADGGAVCAQDN